MKKITLLSLGIAALFIAGSLHAQEIQITQTVVSVPKKVIVEKNMVFDNSEQAAQFWNVYADYEQDIDRIHQQLGELIKDYAMNFRTLTDEQAEELLKRYLWLEENKLAFRGDYIAKFKEVLSAKQVARLYQIENKLDAVARFGLVDAIPLVEIDDNQTAA